MSILSLIQDVYAHIWAHLDTVDLFIVSITCKDLECHRRPMTLKDKCQNELFKSYPKDDKQVIAYSKINTLKYFPPKNSKHISTIYLFHYLYKSDKDSFLKEFIENRSDGEIKEYLMNNDNVGTKIMIDDLNIAIRCKGIRMKASLFLYLRSRDWVDKNCFYFLEPNQMKIVLSLSDEFYDNCKESDLWFIVTPFDEELFDWVISRIYSKIYTLHISPRDHQSGLTYTRISLKQVCINKLRYFEKKGFIISCNNIESISLESAMWLIENKKVDPPYSSTLTSIYFGKDCFLWFKSLGHHYIENKRLMLSESIRAKWPIDDIKWLYNEIKDGMSYKDFIIDPSIVKNIDIAKWLYEQGLIIIDSSFWKQDPTSLRFWFKIIPLIEYL